jgi:hypothetical protein
MRKLSDFTDLAYKLLVSLVMRVLQMGEGTEQIRCLPFHLKLETDTIP